MLRAVVRGSHEKGCVAVFIHVPSVLPWGVGLCFLLWILGGLAIASTNRERQK